MPDRTTATRGGVVPDRDGQRAAPLRSTGARAQGPDASAGIALAAPPAAHASAVTASQLLALQPTAGNRAVSGYLQRAPAPAHNARAHTGNRADYADLLTGVSHLLTVVQQETVDKTDAVVPLNLKETNEKQRQVLAAVGLGAHLTKGHRALLEKLREAFVQARTETPGSAQAAVKTWQSIQGDLQEVFAHAAEYVDGDVGAIEQDLHRVGAQLIYGGAYAEAHNDGLKHLDLADPKKALEEERLKGAVEQLEQVQKFADKGLQLTGEDAVSALIAHDSKLDKDLAHAIFELVRNPGEIAEKLMEFKEQGCISQAVTVAELADKVQATASALFRVSMTTVRRYALGSAERALRAGAEELAEHWTKIGEWAEGKLELLEKVGKITTVISVVVSAIKVVDLVRQGKWGEALKEAATTAAGLAVAAVGGSALVGGTMIVVAAEIEAVHGAAAMIRYARKGNVRDAAWSFVNVCTDAANIEARDLVVDTKLLQETTGEERKIVEHNLTSYTPYWMSHLNALSQQFHDTRESRLGGRPELQAALGAEAVQLLRRPPTGPLTWEAMAAQIRVIFAASQAMAEYVAKNYPKNEKSDEKEHGEGGHKDGGHKEGGEE
jgi:hypothetical protein